MRPVRGTCGKETRGGKKEKVKVCVSKGGRALLWIIIWSCLRLCPWYFDCVFMYVRRERRHLVWSGTEAELLVELLTSWDVLAHGSPDCFYSVREYGC